MSMSLDMDGLWYLIHTVISEDNITGHITTNILTRSPKEVPAHSVNIFNLKCPRDAKWRHLLMSILAQVMACCLVAPIHYQNHYWLILCNVIVLWHSPKADSTGNANECQIKLKKYKRIGTTHFKIKHLKSEPHPQWTWIMIIAKQRADSQSCQYCWRRFHSSTN